MSGTRIPEEKIRETIEFHGHWCPGLATGIRIAEIALDELGKSSDEEIVAVAESDNCAVDAVQFLTGCTVGKGNLILDNIGKVAFSFYRRRDSKAIRILSRPTVHKGDNDEYRQLQEKSNSGIMTEEERERFQEIRCERCHRILEAGIEELFIIKEPIKPAPSYAPMKRSLICEACGEMVMETKARLSDGRTLCLQCFEAEVLRP